jgi:hypothetical protein
LLGDVLDQYERHLSYLHLVRQGDGPTEDVEAGTEGTEPPAGEGTSSAP